MRQKLHDALIRTATPLLNPGETPAATGRARLGQVSLARNAALAAASTVLSGVNLNNAYYVLLTNQRLLLLEPHWLTSRPTAKVVGNIPRPLLSVADVKRAVMTSVTLSIGGEGKKLLLKYPSLDKEGAESLLKALEASGV
ncbi:hypothetical protein Q2K19_27800 [Micromonospora soli]|uniref:hypothetical protein n=1 Tax=Micromonospora sp. NBRC 110009 TaxID=3061627 RepID=UPI002670DC71|nr:hypothetical protein [Micromonospora sp. NBRC 110009]WKT97939.1 hypothetical protein Q2K19_27800 [Micromonospora sp. NBRC 110009]